MNMISTDNEREDLDSIWRQLADDDSSANVTIAMKRLVLIARATLRRIDELQVEVKLIQEREGRIEK